MAGFSGVDAPVTTDNGPLTFSFWEAVKIVRTLARIQFAALLAVSFFVGDARAEGDKQPVFLMCPHVKRYSAWSVYLTVDKSDPVKILTLGLDKLPGVNSVDLDGFSAVQTKQSGPGEAIGTLKFSDFGSGVIKVAKDDALHLSASPVDAETVRLSISMRCTSDKRFVIGGKEQKTRDVVLKYDKGAKKWNAVALTMKDINGRKILESGAPLAGIRFPVTGTGIYQIVAISGGDEVVLIDGWRKEPE